MKVMSLDDEGTLLPDLKPMVAPCPLMARLALSLTPLMVMGPDLAKTLEPPNPVATSTAAVPDFPVMEMPPPVPVASILPPKLIPKLALVPLTAEASPSTMMA
ncbi:hypothetical protein LINBF2_13080 [Limnohabitans sp. INBF002]|nr:hypothetical protein LINBF2_13080 [Limnohabitans sp. INBF002]